jgi:hypothetical protein
MDLQAYSLIGTGSSHWANLTALLCFALACGLLMGSLAGSLNSKTAGTPPAVQELQAPVH